MRALFGLEPPFEDRLDVTVREIDSPPALPLTDARLLAQHADAVVFVVKAGATTVEQTQTIQECFRHDGTHIFGSILNHWDARREDPSYLTAYMKYAVSSKNVKRAEVKRSPRFLVAPAAEREETQSAGNWD